jgi:hypothetical protein
MVIKLVVLVLLPCLSLSLSPESVSLVSFNLQFFSSYSHQLSGLEEKNGNPTPILKISKPRSNSKTPGLARVARVPGWPARSTEFRRANSPTGFYLNPDRSQTRVGRVLGRPAGPVRVLKLCYPYTSLMLMNKQWSYRKLLYLILYTTFNVDENDSIIALISIEI